MPCLEFEVRKHKDARSLGASITPPLGRTIANDNAALCEIEDLCARVEVSPKKVNVPEMRLRANERP
jgi:hypothetical protein